jgi:hypothetical protein
MSSIETPPYQLAQVIPPAQNVNSVFGSRLLALCHSTPQKMVIGD